MRWVERFRMAMLMLFRRKAESERLIGNWSSTLNSRSRKTSALECRRRKHV